MEGGWRGHSLFYYPNESKIEVSSRWSKKIEAVENWTRPLFLLILEDIFPFKYLFYLIAFDYIDAVKGEISLDTRKAKYQSFLSEP